MITQLRVQNFKSWRDTGTMRLAPLTALFGTNSSGKTSLLQFLLLLKQSAEFTDRSSALYLGGDGRALVDLGTFQDIIHQRKLETCLEFALTWTLAQKLRIGGAAFDQSTFEAAWQMLEPPFAQLIVKQFTYHIGNMTFGMQRLPQQPTGEMVLPAGAGYRFETSGYALPQLPQGVPALSSSPVRFYGFPGDVYTRYQKIDFLNQLTLEIEKLFEQVFYLGPLREYPHRSYLWGGGALLRDVGKKGELAIQALVASSAQDVEAVLVPVAEHLKQMGLVYDFALRPIAPNRKDWEVWVRKDAQAPEVLITDIGFGVSQVLPVLVLCYYVPKGATLILEQPEIHLHPLAQASLADVLIEVVKKRRVQIILESHSEHLLTRLQRRIAEEVLPASQAALYFTRNEAGVSSLEPLNLDEYGNITNWPENFFGDEMGERVAMLEAEMWRRQATARDTE